MPVVARTRQRAVPLDGDGSLLTRCLAAGLPLASACSGRGACGRCLTTVLLGIESLPEASLHEQAVLTRIGAAPNQRLGCQCLMPLPGSEILITTGYW